MKQKLGSRLWASRLELASELASLINTTFDLDEIFRAAILKLRRVLEFRRASVALVTEDRRHYYLHTLYDAVAGGFVAAEGTFPVERGLTGRAISSGEAIRVDEYRGTVGIHSRGEGSISALIVPIRVDGQVIGTVNFGAAESGTYDDEDLELAVLLGRQIATSLHYSKLLSTIHRQREALAYEHERVESERNQLEALIDASDAAILMISDNRVAQVNLAMAELVGLPREVLLGAPLERVNEVLRRSLADPSVLSAQIAALESGGAPLRDRVEFQFPRRAVCHRTVATVRGMNDEVEGHLVLFADVTREADAEEAMTEFVSLVSHELRTPLTSVKTSISLLTKGAGGAITSETRNLLEIALRNLDRLIRMVDDLLDLSRIESGRVVEQFESVSLEDAANKAIDAVAGFAQDRGVAISLGEFESGTMVLADSDRLQQVFVNLLSNAVKFSPEDGKVTLGWWDQGDNCVIEIADEGPGIAADHLEEIFDKFRQLEKTATRKHGGAGLGLAISRKIVEQLGGDLWAESEEGRGSRFFVRLRRTHTAPVPSADPVRREIVQRSVMVVEKDSDLQHLFRAQFEEEGWQVAVLSRGSEVLAQAEAAEPGLITVGLELEDMHGLEFLQRLRSSPATINTPALLVGPGGDAAQAIAYGADAWVVGDAEDVVAQAERLVSSERRRFVLLIEDDPAVRVGLARGIRRGGYSCLEVASGEEGLQIARERKPDLLITDFQVPGKDGLSLLKDIRDDASLADVPAIVVTGHPNPEAVEAINSLQASFVPKPFSTSLVLREIERMIGPGLRTR